MKKLKNRLQGRGSETKESFEKRMKVNAEYLQTWARV